MSNLTDYLRRLCMIEKEIPVFFISLELSEKEKLKIYAKEENNE